MVIVSGETPRFLAAEQLREVGITLVSHLLEPVGRNTAPALTLAAVENRQDPVLLLNPVDQTIDNPAAFTAAIQHYIVQAVHDNIHSLWEMMCKNVQVRELTNLNWPGRFPVNTMTGLMQKARLSW